MAKKRKIRRIQKNNAPKECYFHVEKKEPNFIDVASLNKFLTERSKIIPKSRSGLCGKHQKRLAEEVKRARYMALLPFAVNVK
ncbi:MAG: 30S ribosomal protein S18 [Candidatus Levybacteria bacterium RIFCSPLOWO2_01_FULL_36_13]|nr:MAG: 30S ribosomal protein S18 [Candidatus Levybacteria bacterium RIFCSPHIGHO2_01_FULL_36_15b]OGH35424.1 MAG: 30S ribosomal protein S18 [Candidatus Levybacteria bacterium RIFCSPLOWO2_01_FULL_36_13]